MFPCQHPTYFIALPCEMPHYVNQISHIEVCICFPFSSTPFLLTWNGWTAGLIHGIMALPPLWPTWPLDLAFSSPGKITPGLFSLCSQVWLFHLLIYTVFLTVLPLKGHEDNSFFSVSSQSLRLPLQTHWLVFGGTSPLGETPASNQGVSGPVCLTDIVNSQNQPGEMGQGLMTSCDILIGALQAHLARQMHMCRRWGNWG